MELYFCQPVLAVPGLWLLPDLFVLMLSSFHFSASLEYLLVFQILAQTAVFFLFLGLNLNRLSCGVLKH